MKVVKIKANPKTAKVFLTQKEIGVLGLNIKATKYKKFIYDVHKRIFIDIVMGSREGYLMPYRLGQLAVNQRQKLAGVYLKCHSAKANSDLEYNGHTFGKIFEISWNREIFNGIRSRYEIVSSFPYYNHPLIHFKVYNFKANKPNRKLMKYNILNNNFLS